MKPKKRIAELSVLFFAATTLMLVPGERTWAHCDTEGGPVIPEARIALASGEVTPVLKRIRPEDEPEIRKAFARAVAVRKQGAEALDLADRYFIETLVRVHRAGEGAPFTGVKDEPVDPIVAMADQALADGSVDGLAAKIGAHLSAVIQEKFVRARETSRLKEKSVEAGRAFVEAYVDYVHYIERVHAAIVSTGTHGHATAEGNAHTEGHQQE
jgi:hypothetical protein